MIVEYTLSCETQSKEVTELVTQETKIYNGSEKCQEQKTADIGQKGLITIAWCLCMNLIIIKIKS